MKTPLFLATALIAVPASAAIVIADPGFDTALVASGNAVLSSEVNAWQRNGAAGAAQSWIRTTSLPAATGSSAGVAKYNDSTQNDEDSRALVQVITGASGSTGTQTLSFNYLLNDAQTAIVHDLKLRVEVFGISSASWTGGSLDLAMANTNANVAPEDTVTPGPIAVLLNSTAFSKTTDATLTAATWQTANFSIDLGSGYDLIGIRFTASDGVLTDTQATTTIALDNVSIVPESASLMLALAGLSLLGIRRR